MENQQFNSLVVEYQTSGDPLLFNTIYQRITDEILTDELIFSKMSRTVVIADLTAMRDDAIVYCIAKYDLSIGNFDAFLNWKFKRKRINHFRDSDKLTAEVFISEAEESFIESTAYDPDPTAIKRVDQRKLIDSLTKNMDAKTTAIVKAFPQYKSITALGKALGLHHMTVTRALEKLASNFDEKQFGDYRDYLVAQ